MKKVRLAAFFLTLCLSSLCAYADHDHDDDRDKDKHKGGKTDATEMSVLGLAAASVLGAGSYLVYRRRARARG
ncbi:MAG TPA: hypothetical protein VIB39_17965 [Candidatus Angelobacter sp.]|jgi:hypothetical protein